MESIDLDKYATRQEAVIVRRLVSRALKRGWLISVNDGEEWVVKHSAKRMEILEALASTGGDVLVFRDPTDKTTNNVGALIGKVWLVYDGNANGIEVISDHSDNEVMNGFIATLDR